MVDSSDSPGTTDNLPQESPAYLSAFCPQCWKHGQVNVPEATFNQWAMGIDE